MRTSDFRYRVLMISMRWRTPTGTSSTSASGSTRRPWRSEISTIRARAAEHHVLRDGEDRHEHEVLVNHADARSNGVAGTGEGDRLVVDEDLALVGLVEAVEDVHERGLARAVLTEQPVDLAGTDDQVDALVGDDARKPLCDPPQLELHAGACS
jgi:hypothetical protein